MKKRFNRILTLCCVVLAFPMTGYAAESEAILPITAKAERTIAYDNQDEIYVAQLVIEESDVDSFAENQEFIFTVKKKPVPLDPSVDFTMLFQQEKKVEISEGTLKAEYEIKDGKLIVRIKESASTQLESFTIPDLVLKRDTERVILRTHSLFVSLAPDTELMPIIADFIEVEEYVEPPEMEPMDIEIKVDANVLQVNGEEKSLKVPAYISNTGYTMLPLREVTEVFPGIQIGWENEIKTAWLLYGFLYADIQYEAAEMHMNGETVALANPAEIRNGRMFIALRDICRICGILEDEVHWDNETKTVMIHTEVNK